MEKLAGNEWDTIFAVIKMNHGYLTPFKYRIRPNNHTVQLDFSKYTGSSL